MNVCITTEMVLLFLLRKLLLCRCFDGYFGRSLDLRLATMIVDWHFSESHIPTRALQFKSSQLDIFICSKSATLPANIGGSCHGYSCSLRVYMISPQINIQ
jgi:hypothetical protein